VLTIGEFSRATGLTIKTIRFYHEQGLLLPTCVDPESGYRYYDQSRVETARAIAALRGLGLSLAEIAGVVRSAGDDADLLDVLARRKVAVDDELGRLRDVKGSLDRLISAEKEARLIMARSSFEVEEKDVPRELVAGIRMKGRYSDCGKGFARIGRRLGRQVCGKPFMLHYDEEYREEDADFEACFPVRRGESGDGISVRDLEGGRALSLMHLGPYEELGRSYALILGHARDRGLEIVPPTREVYHKGPGMIFKGNPRKYLTEILVLVRPVRS
jgi:DNA-binding transcriptional MerR regulator